MADTKISVLPAANLPLGSTDAIPVVQGGVTKQAPRSAFDGAVTSVAGRTGIVVLAKSDVGLTNVENTADAAKPVSTAQAAADAAVLASANATTAAHVANVSNPHATTAAQVGADATGTAAAALAAHNALANPHTQYPLASSLATVATSGVYNDLTGKPTLGTLAAQNGTFSGTSSGTNTGDQTNITGNAGTATALQTARMINGVAFDGTAPITINAVDATPRAPIASPTFTGTVTLPAGQVVNGVTLTAAGSSSNFLNAAGSYTAASGGGISTGKAIAMAMVFGG